MKKFSMGVIHWFCKARTPIGQIPMLRNFAQSQEANTVFEDDELRFNLGDKFTFFI